MLPLDIWLDNRKQGDSEMLDEDYPILLSIQQAARKIGKSEKTIRRWIKDGKLPAENRGGGYLIKREDLEAVTKHVTKEWQEQGDLAHINLEIILQASAIKELREVIYQQQMDIEELQAQVKKLQPKKTPAAKRKTSTRPPTR